MYVSIAQKGSMNTGYTDILLYQWLLEVVPYYMWQSQVYRDINIFPSYVPVVF